MVVVACSCCNPYAHLMGAEQEGGGGKVWHGKRCGGQEGGGRQAGIRHSTHPMQCLWGRHPPSPPGSKFHSHPNVWAWQAVGRQVGRKGGGREWWKGMYVHQFCKKITYSHHR